MLDIALSIIMQLLGMWWLFVPVAVMGIFALAIRLSLRHYN
jgi:hypothetical protein